MYSRKPSLFLGPLLLLLSRIYGLVVRLRTTAYTAGLLPTKRLPCRVISVGNITLGGTGKTPMVINIARMLQAQGIKPLVLSRGYGRTDETSTAVVSDGVHVLLGPAAAGDEPVLIANRLASMPVVVGRDRHGAGSVAFERFHPDCIVLDDGFQHIRLARDLNIALVDGADPFGNGKLFPAGILREPLTALQRADVVVITRADECRDLVHLRKMIGQHTSAPILTACYQPTDLVDVATGKTLPLVALRGSQVLSFSGIARPGALDSLLASLGAVVAETAHFPDHHPYTDKDLSRVFRQASGSTASLIVTTEKDGVRLKGRVPEGIWALRIDMHVIEQKPWEDLLAGQP